METKEEKIKELQEKYLKLSKLAIKIAQEMDSISEEYKKLTNE